MRHSPVRVDKGAGDGTQPAPALLQRQARAELSAARKCRWRGRLLAWVMLLVGVVAFYLIRLTVGDPFKDS